MKLKPITYFLCAVTLVLILFSPWLILSADETQPGASQYQGVLTLWHITGWRAGGSTGASFLKKRVKEFESSNGHVFIEVQSMTLPEALDALQAGETPDMVSYPFGVDPGVSFSPLPAKDVLFSYITDFAYPYMCGGYCILVNTDTLNEQGQYVSDDWGIRPDELVEAVQLGIGFDAEDGYSSLPAIALHEYPAATGPNISTWGEPEMPDAALCLSNAVYTDAFESFCQGETCVLIASHRQLFEATQLYEQNECPSFCAYAIGGYTDMVQLIGVTECEDSQKQAVCTAFAEYLISDSVQKKLEALGVFPVIPDLEIYSDNLCLNAMYELLHENAALPDPDNQETLDTLAQEAFQGDHAALKKIRRILRGSG